MKILFAALILALASMASGEELGRKVPFNLQWWIDYYSNKERTHLVVGDAEIPMEWFLKASPHVKRNIQDWFFTFPEDSNKRVMGTLDENQKFVTWPGAKIFPEGEYPEGYIFARQKRKGSEPQTGVSF